MPKLEVIRPNISEEEREKRLKALEDVLSSIYNTKVVLVKESDGETREGKDAI